MALRTIIGLPKVQAELIERSGRARSMDELRRYGASRRTIERLARADAFGSLRLNRRASVWESLRPPTTSPLFQDDDDSEPPLILPAMDCREEVFADFQTTGLSLKAHPISFSDRS